GVGDIELAAQILDVERREVRRQLRVNEGVHQGDRRVVLIEDINGAGVEVGGIEATACAAVGDGHALVNRVRRGVVAADYGVPGALPSGDGAVFGGDDEFVTLKIGRIVESDPGGVARRGAGGRRRNRHRRLQRAGAVENL